MGVTIVIFYCSTTRIGWSAPGLSSDNSRQPIGFLQASVRVKAPIVLYTLLMECCRLVSNRSKIACKEYKIFPQVGTGTASSTGGAWQPDPPLVPSLGRNRKRRLLQRALCHRINKVVTLRSVPPQSSFREDSPPFVSPVLPLKVSSYMSSFSIFGIRRLNIYI
ncbi:hypothetical protein AVEN_247002-1 [Araneus ventricosus]|uniref:Uncharacterized protein n=1 Tax=Araneus ventricosus TaxID=182803 RepID=A0A4Y2JYK7_ARAVE|nr:hypothetical protein AVEN_247002-1 [Araneus ventricosus]